MDSLWAVFCVNVRAGTSVAICSLAWTGSGHTEKDRAERNQRNGASALSELCLITECTLDLSSYTHKPSSFLWYKSIWVGLPVTSSKRHTDKAINRSGEAVGARSEQRSWGKQKWSVDKLVGSASHLTGTVLLQSKGHGLLQNKISVLTLHSSWV